MLSYKWIMYIHTPMPGDTGVYLRRVTSNEGAREALLEFERNSGFRDSCTASLYWYTSEAWEDAEEHRLIGCPFDYPDKILERGPRGGIRIIDA